MKRRKLQAGQVHVNFQRIDVAPNWNGLRSGAPQRALGQSLVLLFVWKPLPSEAHHTTL